MTHFAGRNFFLYILAVVLVHASSAHLRAVAVQSNAGFSPSDGTFDRAAYEQLHREVQLWDTLKTAGPKSARLQIGPITLQSELNIEVAGTFSVPGIRLYWEDVVTHERQGIGPRTSPVGQWTRLSWRVPQRFVGRAVYLVAEDNTPDDSSWIGLSSPLPSKIRFVELAKLCGLHAWVYILLLLPGVACLALVAKRTDFSATQSLAVIVTGSALLAYTVFFIYLIDPLDGKSGAWGIIILSIATCGIAGRRSLPILLRPLLVPLVLVFLIDIFYIAILLLYGGMEIPMIAPLERFMPGMPPDPILPFWFSEKLYLGQPPRPFFLDWLTSDRPPLQTGFHLLILPFTPQVEGYAAMGTLLQTWVFLGIYFFLRQAGVGAKATAWVLFFSIFSGFFLFNSTFIWPKLLPAGLSLIGAGLLLYSRGEKKNYVLIGLALALAFLSHGGSAFGIIALLAVFATSTGWRALRPMLVTGLTAAVCVLPWSLYQKFYDPPGNRLLKWHLAGVIPLDGRSFSQSLKDSYGSLTVDQYLKNKEANFRTLFRNDDSILALVFRKSISLASAGRTSLAWREFTYSFRITSFGSFFQALGLLNIGFPVALGILFSKKADPALRRLVRTTLLLCTLGILIWCVLVFPPGGTANHLGAYFINACGFMFMSLGIVVLPAMLRWAIAVLHLLGFVFIWIFSSVYQPNIVYLLPGVDSSMVLLCLAALVGVIVWLFQLAAESSAAGHASPVIHPVQ